MKLFSRVAMIVILSIIVIYVLIVQWSWIFSKTIIGRIEAVEKAATPIAVIGEAGGHGTVGSRDMFSFAVAIRQDDGKIITASSEDRQWAVVKVGICVRAVYYPYPPWDLDKGGTYFNARLKEQFDCPNQNQNPPATPTQPQ